MIERLLKVARPATAATVVVPESVPPAGLVPIAIVTLAVLVVRLLNWSSMRTVTAGLIETPATVLVGCCRKRRWSAAAGVMLTVGDVAIAVRVPPLCFVCVVKVLTPVVVGAVTFVPPPA